MANMLMIFNNIESMAKRGNFSIPVPDLTPEEKMLLIVKGFEVTEGKISWGNEIETLAMKMRHIAENSRDANVARNCSNMALEPETIRCFV